jgi:hypothetical protein
MRIPALVLLILGTMGFGCGVAAALFMLLFTPFMFDAPGSTGSIYPLLILASLALYPFIAVGGLISAWQAFGREDFAGALRRLLIPLIGVGLVVAAFVVLEVVCNGEFACR